jgi:hypothetical protein
MVAYWRRCRALLRAASVPEYSELEPRAPSGSVRDERTDALKFGESIPPADGALNKSPEDSER